MRVWLCSTLKASRPASTPTNTISSTSSLCLRCPSGRDQRSYVLVDYTPLSSFSLEAKYGMTWYPHRRTIGSGLGATDGNRVRELRLQVR